MLSTSIFLILFQIFSFFDSNTASNGLDLNTHINLTSRLDLSQTCSPGPIDVITDQAINTFYLADFTYHISIYTNLWLKNTGMSATLTPVDKNSGNILSKGPLGNEQYALHEIEFLWTEDGIGSSGPTIDGEGEPFQMVLKFREMTKKDDWLMVFVGVNVEDTNGTTNSRFDAIRENGFNKITEPGSEVKLNHLEAVSVFIVNADLDNFFFYLANIQFRTGPMHYCAKVIQLNSDKERTISYEESLLNLKLYDSSRSNTIGVLPNDGRTVERVNGMKANIDNYIFTGDEL